MPRLLLFLTLLLFPASVQADAVVLNATAPGLKPGQVIGPEVVLRVPEGASATLLLSTGRMIKLSGPYDGPAATAADATPGGALNSLFGGKGVDISSLGGTRTVWLPALEAAHAGAEVVIDTAEAATWCVPAARHPPQGLRLSRPDPRRPATLILENTATGATARQFWAAGIVQQSWPDSLPVTDGAEFRARWEDAPATVTRLRLRVLAEAGETDHAWLAHLTAAGCRRQAQPLLQELSLAVAPLDVYLGFGGLGTLVLQTNRDAHVYCYRTDGRTDGDGRTVVPLSPAGTAPGARIEGHRPVSLPTDAPGVPAGEGAVRCFAADRDISRDLPAELTDGAALPLPEGTARALDRIFKNLPEATVKTAQVTLPGR